jgi:hypothetical protein
MNSAKIICMLRVDLALVWETAEISEALIRAGKRDAL